MRRRLPSIRITRRAYQSWRGPIFTIGCLGGSRRKPKESYQKALDLAYKAVALDPRDGDGTCTLGYFLLYGRKFDQAAGSI